MDSFLNLFHNGTALDVTLILVLAVIIRVTWVRGFNRE